MSTLLVRNGTFTFQGKTYRCTIGRAGISENKKEGDGTTPAGIFPLRECWYRPDRVSIPKTALPLKVIRENDGWCDDPKSPDYNRHVKLPCKFSHELLWRGDHAYDFIVPIGYNDEPAIPGKGSAIFLHVMHDDGGPTAGCIAITRADMLELLPLLSSNTLIDIQKA